MRKKTSTEFISDRGDVVRLEICSMRSPFKPQWWEIRKQFRWRLLMHRVKNDRQKLSAETQRALAWAEESIERELLFGKET